MTEKDPAKIPTQIKDPDLVQKRRSQIADAAVGLFIDKGFHKTTTRQIAKAAGIAIGSIYCAGEVGIPGMKFCGVQKHNKHTYKGFAGAGRLGFGQFFC